MSIIRSQLLSFIATIALFTLILSACSPPDAQQAVATIEEIATENADAVDALATEAVDLAEEVVEQATSPPEPTAESAEPTTEIVDKVVIAYNGYENNITPFTHSLTSLPNTHDLVMLIYDSLFWSANSPEPEPWLAESAEPNDDYTVWTVALRPGVSWHDGEPFASDDVAFSFEYYLNSGLPGRYAHHVYDQPRFDHAEIIDDMTLSLHFAGPVPTFKRIPGGDLPIIPKHIWESIDDPSSATEMLPIGTGPYKLVENVTDELYRFEANHDYFMGRPLVEVIEMPIITAPAAAWAALDAGQVDFVARDVAPPLVARYSSDDAFRVQRGTHMTSINLFFNTRRAPLSDPQLRRAISLGIDKQALVDIVMLGNARVGNDGFVHPDSPWVLPDAGHAHDPAEAQRLLDAGGYTERDEDGIRLSPNGERLEFDILIPTTAPLFQRATQLVAEQLQPLGIQFNVVALETAAIRQRRSPAVQFDFDAFMQPLESHTHADPDGLYYFFHSPGKGVGAVFSGYSNPAFDALAEQAAVTIDRDERREMLYEMQRMIAEEVPAIVYYYPDGIYATRIEAYDGWVVEPGHGAFTKRSFLPGNR